MKKAIQEWNKNFEKLAFKYCKELGCPNYERYEIDGEKCNGSLILGEYIYTCEIFGFMEWFDSRGWASFGEKGVCDEK